MSWNGTTIDENVSEIKTEPKRQKWSNEANRMENLSTSIKESSIFWLNDDCFVEIFNYLSVKDLYSFGQTCNAIHRLTGKYFKCNYLAAFTFSGENGIYTEYSDNYGAHNQRTQTSGFNQFVSQISHFYEKIDPLYYIQSHSHGFESTIWCVCRWMRPELNVFKRYWRALKRYKSKIVRLKAISIRMWWNIVSNWNVFT